jgi:hypothetical protein
VLLQRQRLLLHCNQTAWLAAKGKERSDMLAGEWRTANDVATV